MSLRTLIRLLAIALVSMPLSVLLWNLVGPWPLLTGPMLFLLTCGYLVLLAGEGDLTRWQLRYQLDAEADREHLENVLRFLAGKAGHFTVEANARGLFLELPQALDRYVEAHLPKALPELRLSRAENGRNPVREGPFFLCVGPLSSDLLRWATEENGKQVRLHIHQGPYATFRTDRWRLPSRPLAPIAAPVEQTLAPPAGVGRAGRRRRHPLEQPLSTDWRWCGLFQPVTPAAARPTGRLPSYRVWKRPGADC